MYYNVQYSHEENFRMKTISFTEFRKSASNVLDLVEKGAIIRITRHGKAIARIVPAERRDSGLAWKRPGLRLGQWDAHSRATERRSSH
jgi:prevent-host-death family protein